MNKGPATRELEELSISATRQSIDIVTVGPDIDLLTSVISLGDRSKGTVGLLPRDAYYDYAKREQIFAAVDPQIPSKALGYVLFRVSSSEIKLVHLVVAQSSRGQGVARQLVDHLSSRYEETRGITLKCKRSYNLGLFWQRLGFAIRGEVDGRGKDRAPLTVWHKSHGHQDLLTWTLGEASVVPVLLDANVFYDYVSTTNSKQAITTRAVLDVELNDEIQILVSPELRMEIDRLDDDQERTRLLGRVAAFPDLPVPMSQAQRLADEILHNTGLSTKVRRQHRSDALHLAFAILADIPYLVTMDNRLQRLGALSVMHGKPLDVEVVSLGQLVRIIDERHDGDRYRPSSFRGTALKILEQNRPPTFIAQHHQNFGQSESKAHFVSIVESLMQDSESTLAEIVGHDNHAIGLLGYRTEGTVLTVSLIRMAPSRLGHTVSRLILGELRSIARDSGASAVQITDSSAGVFLEEAALADYFSRQRDGSLVALCPDSSGTPTETMTMIRSYEAENSWELPQLHALFGTDGNPNSGIELEFALRPYLLVDNRISTYLVPIRHQWAVELLGVPDPGLWERQLGLGLSGEHVYYRAPTGNIQAPARILWYVPASGVTDSGAMARSYLTEVMLLEPEKAHNRFNRLGIYARQDVLNAARGDKVQVLRFTGTQKLSSAIDANELRSFASRSGVQPFFQGPWKIPSSLFFELMMEHSS